MAMTREEYYRREKNDKVVVRFHYLSRQGNSRLEVPRKDACLK